MLVIIQFNSHHSHIIRVIRIVVKRLEYNANLRMDANAANVNLIYEIVFNCK